jgi:hypothetical protein
MANFKKRIGIGSRVTKIVRTKNAKTPELESEKKNEIENYLTKVTDAMVIYGAKRVFNSDETPLKTTPESVVSCQIKGKETVKLQSPLTPDSFAASACGLISAAGEVLPCLILKKGVKKECQSYQDLSAAAAPFGSKVTLTKEGFMRQEAMPDLLDIVQAHAQRLPCALIVDCHASHCTASVFEAATARQIELIFVPKCFTSELQPLDVGFFSYVKAGAKKDWDVNDPFLKFFAKFMQAYKNFNPENVRTAFCKACRVTKEFISGHLEGTELGLIAPSNPRPQKAPKRSRAKKEK